MVRNLSCTKHTDIIRHSAGLCKEKFKAFTDFQIFKDACSSFELKGAECPHCHAQKLEEFASYIRWLICWDGKKYQLIIIRYICKICGHTHALLPDIITPYGRYSLRFKLHAVDCYHNRSGSIENLCAELNIAISTLYRWLKKFKEHKALDLGALPDKETTDAGFVERLLEGTDLSQMLRRFFHRFSFSFWQGRTTHCRRRENCNSIPP
jgi:transposase-like protein